MRPHALIMLATCGVLSLAACDEPQGPAIGALRVSVATTGGDLDLDGYTVAVDGGGPQSVAINGTTVVPGLAAGSHDVSLGHVADNCTVAGPNPSAVAITRGDTVQVSFAVACVPTGVAVTVATGGLDIDLDGYAVSVDGAAPVALPVNGSVSITRLTAGPHSVTLSGLAGNCAPPEETNPRSLDVPAGEVVAVAFSVTCRAVHGVVEIRAATSGSDLDPNGYSVQLDGGTPQPLPLNGTVRFSGVHGGEHTVTLAGMTVNCPVSGDNPRTVSVTTGEVTRDTARTTFQVICHWRTGIAVMIATSGSELDVNGYFVGVDYVCVPDPYGGDYCYYVWSEWASANDTVRFPTVPVGEHAVYLNDIAPNCRLAADNPSTATVPPGDAAIVTFAVTCEQTGSVRVSVTTTGADLDPDGYSLQVQGAGYLNSYDVGTNANVTISQLLAGEHSVTLSSLTANCAENGQNPVTATVVAGATVDVAFAVTCAALGSMQLTAVTTGVDLDPDGYSVRVQRAGFDQSYGVSSNGTVTISGLAAGDYVMALHGAALNCAIASPNPRTVAVPTGGTAVVQFDVVCAALGSVQVTAVTTGFDLDPDGYSVRVQRAGFDRSYGVSSNGTVTISGLVAGDYVMALHGAALNCAIASPNPRTVAVPSGGTAVVQFDVACAASAQLAVVRNGEIYLIKSNGTGLTRLTTNTAWDEQPAWSPDGGKIAFATNRDGNAEIYVMNADGSNPVRLTNHPGFDAAPAWSPDGSTIAFTSDRDGNLEIYVTNADGSNPVRLTNHPDSDADPAWSPDGTKLGFSRGNDLYVMNADGSGAAQLTAGSSSDTDPAWSPDGRWIAYVASVYYCDDYGCYSDDSVQLVRPDGTGAIWLMMNAFQPAWRS